MELVNDLKAGGSTGMSEICREHHRRLGAFQMKLKFGSLASTQPAVVGGREFINIRDCLNSAGIR